MKQRVVDELTKPMRMNLQYFAAGGDDDGGGSDDHDDDDGGDDGGDDDDDDEGGKSEKMFTQDEVNALIEKRISKEKKKLGTTRKELEEFRAYKKSKAGKEDEDKGGKDDTELKATQAERDKLETKVMCLERGVSKENIDDVVALASAYVDEDTDIEDAIEKVLKKYPSFTKGIKEDSDEDDDDDQDDSSSKSWGRRQSGKGTPKLTGVEAAFYKKNPHLRPN